MDKSSYLNELLNDQESISSDFDNQQSISGENNEHPTSENCSLDYQYDKDFNNPYMDEESHSITRPQFVYNSQQFHMDYLKSKQQQVYNNQNNQQSYQNIYQSHSPSYAEHANYTEAQCQLIMRQNSQQQMGWIQEQSPGFDQQLPVNLNHSLDDSHQLDFGTFQVQNSQSIPQKVASTRQIYVPMLAKLKQPKQQFRVSQKHIVKKKKKHSIYYCRECLRKFSQYEGLSRHAKDFHGAKTLEERRSYFLFQNKRGRPKNST